MVVNEWTRGNPLKPTKWKLLDEVPSDMSHLEVYIAEQYEWE